VILRIGLLVYRATLCVSAVLAGIRLSVGHSHVLYPNGYRYIINIFFFGLSSIYVYTIRPRTTKSMRTRFDLKRPNSAVSAW